MGLSQNHVNQIYDHIFAYGLESLKFHALVSNYRKDLFISIPLHTHTNQEQLMVYRSLPF